VHETRTASAFLFQSDRYPVGVNAICRVDGGIEIDQGVGAVPAVGQFNPNMGAGIKARQCRAIRIGQPERSDQRGLPTDFRQR
jgi:hypothetical protein